MRVRVAGMAAGPAAGAALPAAPQPRANLTDWSKAPTLRMSKTWICRGMGKYVGARAHTAPFLHGFMAAAAGLHTACMQAGCRSHTFRGQVWCTDPAACSTLACKVLLLQIACWLSSRAET